ncbi:beta-1,4-glucuronyltransferase 1-like isoform X1 [Drosophila nasuta]|uniref:beta-1,4-glucuronyltransferase 1-like isoform X1 n=1 Tax=Drosophila nasuta TaxID=42062 RepID=UPI00295E3534|nr:beta-1,4-glucuronyltransferase 1-like isoform X1 [Drosophila nasuta]
MLPVYRRGFLKILFITTIGLVLILFITRSQLHKTKRSAPSIYFNRPHLQLEQNGDYWIYNNFMRSKTNLKGNMSLTLTTHGTYRDFNHMKWLLVRWSAPISIAVYVGENDYEQLLESLYYIKYCTVFSLSWPHWISMQLVFHDKHMPQLLYRISSKRPQGFSCRRSSNEETKYGTTLANHRLTTKYPLNLLRNVARLNAQTYYVLALEPGMLPTRNLAIKFLQFVHLQPTFKTQKSVYCLPVFPPMGEDVTLPKYKSDLKIRLKPYLNGSITLSPSETEQLNNFRPWLGNPVRDGDIIRYSVADQPQLCPVYISSNAYEPLYDQRYGNSTSDSNFMQMQVLAGLGFDFVVLDGSFIIRRQSNWQTEVSTDVADRILSTIEQKHIREVIKMNVLA